MFVFRKKLIESQLFVPIDVNGDKFAYEEVRNIMISSEREPEFNLGPMVRITLYHFLYYTFFIPGLLLSIIIEKCIGGNLRLFDNIMFTGPGCNPLVIVQIVISATSFGAVAILSYNLYYNDQINGYDYFDFAFALFQRSSVIASKYALYSPQTMTFINKGKITFIQLTSFLIGFLNF